MSKQRPLPAKSHSFSPDKISWTPPPDTWSLKKNNYYLIQRRPHHMSMTCMFNCFTNAWDTVIFARASWFRFIRSWWCLMLLHLHEIIILLLLILHKFTMFSLNIPPCCTCCGLALFQMVELKTLHQWDGCQTIFPQNQS